MIQPMDVGANVPLLRQMVQRIVEDFAPLRVLLFGSLARGEGRYGSDIDLLVVLPHVDDQRGARIAIRRALADFPVGKDILVTTPNEIKRRGHIIGTVLRSALKEGQLLYEQR